MSEHPWLKRYPDGINWQAPLTGRPLPSLLDRAAEDYPNSPAIDFLGRTYTFHDLHRLAGQAAAGLQSLGVVKGMAVGLFLPNCPQFVIAAFGILRLGGVAVCLDPLASEEELQQQAEDCGCELLITLDLADFYPKAQSVLQRSERLRKLVVATLAEALPLGKRLMYPMLRRAERARVAGGDDHMAFRQLLAQRADVQPAEIDPDADVAAVVFTGGASGVPRPVALSHANLHVAVQQLAAWLPGLERGRERILGVLPLSNGFALTAVMGLALQLGAEIVLHPVFDPLAVLRDIAAKHPTVLPGAPAMFAALAGYPEVAEYDLTSLKHGMAAGAPLPAAVRQRFEQLAKCRVVETYGLAEATAAVTATAPSGSGKPGSIGLPLPGTRLVITDRNDPARVLPQGEAGEICIAGPQVMQGYWLRPEATAAATHQEWLRTGDLGYLDEDGFAFILDRMQDLILCSGFTVYPRHVEQAILQHPAVAEAMVIGVPDDHRGECPKAFVRLQEGVEAPTAEMLMEFLGARLGRYELPNAVEFRTELPRTVEGRPAKKTLLAEELRHHHARRAAAARAAELAEMPSLDRDAAASDSGDPALV